MLCLVFKNSTKWNFKRICIYY